MKKIACLSDNFGCFWLTFPRCVFSKCWFILIIETFRPGNLMRGKLSGNLSERGKELEIWCWLPFIGNWLLLRSREKIKKVLMIKFDKFVSRYKFISFNYFLEFTSTALCYISLLSGIWTIYRWWTQKSK